MSDTYGTTGTTGTTNDDNRELGAVEVVPASSTDDFAASTTSSSSTSTSASSGGAKDEALATGAHAKDGAAHVAGVGKDELQNVVQETGQQAKELWQQTRSELMDQSAQQQTRVAQGLRALSQELSSMASGSQEQGMATDLAKQASQRAGDAAGWLDQRDPGSLVTEVKQFARQRPGAFLAAAAVIGLVGGRMSRSLAAEHKDQKVHEEHLHQTGTGTSDLGAVAPVTPVAPTAGYPSYDSPSVATPTGSRPAMETPSEFS